MLKQLVLAGMIGVASVTTLSAQAAPAAPANTQATAKPATPPKEMASAKPQHKATAEQIKMAQEALIKDGLFKGKATGVWSKELEASIKKYQTQNKLKATGGLDEETLKKLAPAAPMTTPATQ